MVDASERFSFQGVAAGAASVAAFKPPGTQPVQAGRNLFHRDVGAGAKGELRLDRGLAVLAWRGIPLR